jgi:hypothetical protein
MALYDQAPGKLDARAKAGDEFSMLLTFSIALTGYTFAAAVTPASGGAAVDMAVTETDLAEGQITIGLTEAQTQSLGAGTHRWSLAWTAPGSVKRTVLAGQFQLWA